MESQKVFQITHTDSKTKARTGLLHTKSGTVKTPFFMPVATKAAAKFINTPQLKEIGANVIISNALILHLNPGEKLIKKLGGIRKFMNFHGINVTDSGGFQMYSESIYLKSNDIGVHFKNPKNGDKIFMTPEKNMEIQLAINSDIAMCLDSMPMYEESKTSIKEAVRLTTLWAQRCKIHHSKLQKLKPKNRQQLLFGITQGGIHPDLREQSIKDLAKLNFDGYSIGGFGLGESWKEEMKIVKLQKSILPENKPIYLMGIGSPIEILEAIGLGVDMFDSRLPTQNARRGTLFTSIGPLKLLNKKYEHSKDPIDKKCDCFVCQNYTRAYIRFLLREQEPIGKELASYHNLFFLTNIIQQARGHIKSNTFSKFKKDFIKSYKN
ncbi:tRNA guanosine(34) transglycosylase Tgt [Candidatus Pacearchaeota archaeon]|nr:tRNA guanosine(34) transglycosylase Tgt [Candidatus Pacearchaeota archaeon]